MPQDLAAPTSSSSPGLPAIDLAAFQVRRVAERIADAGLTVRRLSASTDWQTPAARAFFALAERLAEDVFALGPLADAVLRDIALVRARAAAANVWRGP